MNPRYPNFAQSLFVAGDVEQFEQHRDPTNGTQPYITIDPEKNVWLKRVFEMKDKDPQARDAVENTDMPMYRNLTADAVDNTFFYLFDKFKKGIFVKIKNNQLAVFLPFSKHNFINEWASRIRYDNTKWDSMNAFLQYASVRDGVQRHAKFNYNVEEWYANNSMFRNEFPLAERDRNLEPLRDMIADVCANRTVPDIEFFINRRDFPLLSKKGYEPYEHIYDSDNVPLKSHAYNKYAPILSMVTTDRHSDIPIPTHEDWTRVRCIHDNQPYDRDFRYTFEMEWDKKKPCAVFRGASTGSGVTDEKEVNPYTFNPRLYAAKLSQQYPHLLDAGITEWNTRPRKIRKEPYLRTVEVDTLGIPLVGRLSPEQQSTYKYVLNLDGHVSAFRLSLELSMGSVVLLQEHTPGMTNYRMWYHRSLIPYVHYVPIRRDLSDLLEKIEWCTLHDDECKQIAANARTFYDQYLSKEGVLDYWQYLLSRIKSTTGNYVYNEICVQSFLLSQQQAYLDNEQFAEVFRDWAKIPYSFDDRDTNAKEALRHLIMGSSDIRLPRLDTSYRSESTRLSVGKIGKLKLSFKTVSQKHDQLVNEAFVGLTSVNKLCKELPNFRFTFGILNRATLVSEYIEGITWDKFVEKCSVEEMIQGMMQICLTLLVAQERCGFVHNDLNGWNIVVKQLRQPITVTYMFRDRAIQLTTSQIPVLIDYGRSHVVFQNHHYGQVHPFKFSPIQDCFCLLISTLFNFVNADTTNDYLQVSLDIANFFTATHFYPQVLRDKTRLVKFLKQYKKYNEMLYAPKNAIEKLTPMHLFEHLHTVSKRLDLSAPFQIKMYPEKCEWTMYPSAPPIVYALLMRGQQTQLQTYIQQLADNVLPSLRDAPHVICFLASVNQFSRTLDGIEHVLGKKLAKLRQQLAQFVSQYLPRQAHTSLVDKMPSRQALVLPRYSPRTFSIPSRLLTILQSHLTEPTTFEASLHDLLVNAFCYEQPFHLTEQEERSLVKANRKLFTWDATVARINCANVQTIRWVANHIFPVQMERVKPFLNARLMEAYQNVLDFEHN